MWVVARNTCTGSYYTVPARAEGGDSRPVCTLHATDLEAARSGGRSRTRCTYTCKCQWTHLVAVQHRLDDAAEEAGLAGVGRRPRGHAVLEDVPQRAAGAQLLHQEDVGGRFVHVVEVDDVGVAR